MRVRCISIYPSEDQILKMGEGFYRRQSFDLALGSDYLVVGLQFMLESNTFGQGAVVNFVREDSQYIHFAPICLFEILDSRVSSYWEMRILPSGTVAFKPPSFFTKYFNDDLTEGVGEVLEEFRRVRKLLEDEFR